MLTWWHPKKSDTLRTISANGDERKLGATTNQKPLALISVGAFLFYRLLKALPTPADIIEICRPVG